MRRPLIATLVLAVVAALATAAFLHTLDAPRALADEPPPRPGGAPGGPGGPPGGPGGLSGGPGGMQHGEMPFDTSMAHADSMVADMIRKLGDKAGLPAESVFKHIEILKGMPASNLPKVMVYGFSRGLGVRCGACHVRNDFPSDERANKRTARAMWKMSLDINRTYLANMKDLEDEMPTVNCWTCHRGHSKPEASVMR